MPAARGLRVFPPRELLEEGEPVVLAAMSGSLTQPGRWQSPRRRVNVKSAELPKVMVLVGSSVGQKARTPRQRSFWEPVPRGHLFPGDITCDLLGFS